MPLFNFPDVCMLDVWHLHLANSQISKYIEASCVRYMDVWVEQTGKPNCMRHVRTSLRTTYRKTKDSYQCAASKEKYMQNVDKTAEKKRYTYFSVT